MSILTFFGLVSGVYLLFAFLGALSDGRRERLKEDEYWQKIQRARRQSPPPLPTKWWR